ncbi:MAG: DUF3365 domain-containing protein [Alcanivorax jadensis]|uniref:Tll0287-like domain-containing protein n=1 Tax=Alcanivorax jadensis TaxID=64988 RepID=UPI003000FE18|tara:strand:- start:477 stop:1085 length:609 start_codon:yes stop_codon:yes gene_type:complete
MKAVHVGGLLLAMVAPLYAEIPQSQSSQAPPEAAIDPMSEPRQHSMALAGALKQALVAAMQSGGPVAAIDVCHVQAMPLTRQISESSGWQVGRTSLKVRNLDNAADEVERDVLARFEQRLQAGEPVGTIEWMDEREENGKTIQHFMKAIPVQAPCMACHGTDLAPAVSQQLDALYPGDQARGYTLGELRGAFTLKRAVPPGS